jgi:hypothetical protein
MNIEDESEDAPRTAGPSIDAKSTGVLVNVEKHVWDKINGWCNAASTEVSGMFMVKPCEGGFHAYDAFLPEQTGSSGYTVFGDEAYDRLKQYVLDKYGMDYLIDVCRGWWHTHYNFSPFWSGTDDNTAQRRAFFSEDSWAVSIVVNQKQARGGDARFNALSGAFYKCRVDLIKPFKVTLDDLPIQIVPNTTKHRKRDYAWDINRWVSRFKPPVSKFKYSVMPRFSDSTANYQNYCGRTLHVDTIEAIKSGLIDDCSCGDWSCDECKATVALMKEYIQ